ncbi:MAG: PKD domain-containing protein [Chitinophagaceae bacterium]
MSFGKRPGLYWFLACCLLLVNTSLKSQQGNIWYFGNFAGVNFNTNPPSALGDGQTNTLEGTSVMCDSTGKVLFYTDGRTIFNRDHDQMLNGFGLKGHKSSYQSSIIVPKPGDRNIYYIFTADAWENDGEEGYCYSEVDMRLDNGLGAVTSQKNIFLAGPSSERLTAIRAADNNSYWVVTNEWSSNRFRAFKVDCNGVNISPVLSAVGRNMTEDTYCNIGILRISPDAKHVIQTNVKGRTQAVPTNEYAQLFDFDDVTGQLSNPRIIPLLNDGYYFGAEISPNSQFAYFVNPFKNTIHQFDITLSDINDVVASKQVFLMTEGSINGIAQGPDQKIYVTTSSPSLHVINKPNVAGVGCDIVPDQLQLTGGSSLSLPNIVPNLYSNRPVDFSFQLIGSCSGTVQFNGVSNIPGVVLEWDFGDGNKGSGLTVQHSYADPNIEYLVKLTATNSANCVYQVVSKRVRPSGEQVEANYGITVQCDQRTIKLLDSSSGGSNMSHQWSFGDGNTSNVASPSHQYANAGVFNVRLTVSSASGCVTDIKDTTIDLRTPVISAGPDIKVSSIQPIQLQATGGIRYQWSPSLYLDNPNIANPVMTARGPVTYTIRGFNESGCSGTAKLNITVDVVRIIEVPNAFRPSGNTNPVLRPVLREIKELTMFQVYNRWGQMVFSTKIIGQGWDGTINGLPQPSGAYVWVLEVVDLDGTIVRKRGTSMLIR